MNKKITILEKKLSLENIDIENIFSQNYIYDNEIAGDFYLNIEDKNYEHSIIISSRYNEENQDNELYKGWFIQIIYNEISLVVGNGKQWINIISNKKLINNIFHHIYFSVNTNKCELYVDEEYNYKENINFVKSCDYLIIGALNINEQYRFYGEIKKLILGKSLQIENIEDSNEKEELCDFNKYINNINYNLLKIDNHLNVLKDMKTKIIKWNLKGLSYNISIVNDLDNQIEKYQNNKNNFINDINTYLEKMFSDNILIKNTNNRINDENIIQKYGKILNNFVKIIKVIDNSKNIIERYKNMNIDIGNSIDTTEKQKNIINNYFESSIDFLIKKYEDSFNLDNIDII